MSVSDMQGALGSRRTVCVLERTELEDRHLRLMEENLLLKKHARSQEEKMKKMATKLLRLTSDEKKELRRDGQPLSAIQLRQRDLETEEVVDELQKRGRELEKANTALKNKVVVLKQQLDSKSKRHTPYDHVQSRISTGLGKKGNLKSYSTEDVSSMKQQSAGNTVATPPLPRYGRSLLEEARRDNQELEELVLQLKQENAVLSAEIEHSQEQLRLSSLQHEEENLQLQEQMQAQLSAMQKSNLGEDLELIRLQRELRERSAELQSVQAKNHSLERSAEVLKASHTKVLQEMETLNQKFKEEYNRNASLQSQLRASDVSQKTVTELREMVTDLRAEKELLKQANSKLMKSALEADRDLEHLTQLKTLQDRIRKLESAAQFELAEKNKMVDKLSNEREVSANLDSELRELRTIYFTLKEEHQQLEEKMKFFSKESSIDWAEVEEALAHIRQAKDSMAAVGAGLPFLERLEEEGGTAGGLRELQGLRSEHADTISELEKTRTLLGLQHNINRDYKREVESLKEQMREQQQEHDSQLREYAQLLDIKAARVKKLEGQLKEIAYGTRPVKIDTARFEYGTGNEEEVELERGQNLFQFHVSQVVLSSEVLSHLRTNNPSIFVTFCFSDFEVQVTSVVQGVRPTFSHTSNFVVTVDDKFLHSLQKGSVHVEVHQASGLKYQTLAMASVRCGELITSSGGKVHGKAVLTGVDSMQQCVNVGSLEYWMRLKLPVTQAIRLYQEKSKALLLMDHQSPTPHTVTSSTTVTPPQGIDYNELIITISRCKDLKAARVPSAYVMYKFYTFPDHDSAIVPASSSPVFSDVKHFPVSMDCHLDEHLSNECLEVYVFDDQEVEETSYLGLARVPLASLAEETSVSGSYQLTNELGAMVGHIELSMQWNLPYHYHAAAAASPSLDTDRTKPRLLNGQSSKDETDFVKRHTADAKHRPVPKLPIKEKPVTQHIHSQTNGLPMLEGRVTKSGKDGAGTLQGTSQESLVSLHSEGRAASKPCSTLDRATVRGKGSSRQNTKTKSKAPAKARHTLPQIPILSAKPLVPSEAGYDSTSTAGSQVDSASVKKSNGPSSKDSKQEESDLEDVSLTPTESELSMVSSLAPKGPHSGTEKLTPVMFEEPEVDRSFPAQGVATTAPVDASATASDGGEGGDGGDSVSVSVTELSSEGLEEEEEVEEELSTADSEEEDTMFGDATLSTQPNEFDDLTSGLSEHSSDNGLPAKHQPAAAAIAATVKTNQTLASEQGEEMDNGDVSSQLAASEAEDGNPITSTPRPEQQMDNKTLVAEGVAALSMSITVESFTLEADSSLIDDPAITQLFVEYQLLDYNYGDLETPSSFPRPSPGESIVFDFRKDFVLSPHQKDLLAAMMQPGDPSEGRVAFTVVSDPEDQDSECVELGTAELDLHSVLGSGEKVYNESIDVISMGEDPEIIGYLTLSVEALDTLQALTLHR